MSRRCLYISNSSEGHGWTVTRGRHEIWQIFDSATCQSGSIEEEEWLLLNCIGGGAARDMACSPQAASNARWIPWIGVGIKLGVSRGSDLQFVAPVEGQAFSFLPLPVMTGLPVHINGSFELSSNRRDIWWGDDMRGDGAARAAWNRALLVVSTVAYQIPSCLE